MGFFRKIGNALARFMYGRNGFDQLGIAMLWLSIILDIVSIFVRSTLLDAAGLAIWVIVLFRVFSKNLAKRRDENSAYLRLIWQLKNKSRNYKQRRQDTDHKYFTCKTCKTVCRVPVGKGKIRITCPKCGNKIDAKT